MKNKCLGYVGAVIASLLLGMALECFAETEVILPVFTRVSVNSNEEQATYPMLGYNGSDNPSISADGKYVTFSSSATNLVTGDTNGADDVFVRDQVAGTTERVSINSSELQASGGDSTAAQAAMSGDGRYVVFASRATNLVTGDTNVAKDIFIRDRVEGSTGRINVNSLEEQAIGGYRGSERPAISADGRYVTFESDATNLVAGAGGDGWGKSDIFVRDRVNGTTEVASVSSSGEIGDLFSYGPSISDDGRYVAFASYASNLVSNDTNGDVDVFIRDQVERSTELVSVNSAGVLSNGGSYSPFISADGRYVVFTSSATNLVSGDTNGINDLFVRDRVAGTTVRISVNSSGQQAEGGWGSYSRSISPNGRYVTFSSSATNLVAGDTNGEEDLFIHDRRSGKTVCFTCANDVGYFDSLRSAVIDTGEVALSTSRSGLVANDTNAFNDIFVSTPVFIEKSSLFLLINNVLSAPRKP